MMRQSILICLFFFVFFSCLSFANLPQPKVCNNTQCVNVEVVSKPGELQRGLMFRQTLAENKGMLFVFSYVDKHAFWMKNMRFHLDIVWIDKNNRIVHIEENVPPCVTDTCAFYAPQKASKYVLEVKNGFVNTHHWKLNQQLKFINF